MDNNKSVLVQCRLQPKTIDTINHLSKITGITNRTRLIAMSIYLADELIQEAYKSSKIYIEHSDGTKERIKIPSWML